MVCEKHSPEEGLFDYVAFGQSVAAEVDKMRSGKFLVYDVSQQPHRLMGIIGLKSPVYFNGARDAHLGWPPLFRNDAGRRTKNEHSFLLRNRALKSIYNIGVCMLASPYSSLRAGRLLSSLCFSPPVIDHLESRYGDPVLGLTTTGGWGGSAGQYERIRLGTPTLQNGQRPHLYARIHGVRPSMNFPHHLFSDPVFETAFATIKASAESARPFAAHHTEPNVRLEMLRVACRLVGLPRVALATNVIAHYFGAVSGACHKSLRSLSNLRQPPAVRTIPIRDALTEWRSKSPSQILRRATALRLSTEAT